MSRRGVFLCTAERSGEIRLLLAGCAVGIFAQSGFAGNRRNALGELPVHSVGHSGTVIASDVVNWTRQHTGAVLLEACETAETGATAVQSVAGYGFKRGRVWRLCPGNSASSSRPWAAGAAGRRDRALCLQYRGNVGHHWAHGKQTRFDCVGRFLSVVISVLHGRRGGGGLGQFPEPPDRMAVIASGSTTHLLDVSFVSSLPGEAGRRKTSRGKSFESASANHRSPGAGHRSQGSDNWPAFAAGSHLRHGSGTRAWFERRRNGGSEGSIGSARYRQTRGVRAHYLETRKAHAG